MIGRGKVSVILAFLVLMTLPHAGLSSPTLQITVFTDKSDYCIRENIYIYGEVKADGSPIKGATVAVEVRDPALSPVVIRTFTTDVLGKYGFSFSLSSEALLGTYTVYVSCNYGGERAANTTTFNLVKASILVVTVTVGRSAYKVEEQIAIYGNVTFGDIPVVGALVAIQVQDPKGTPVLVQVLETGTNGLYNLTFQLPSGSPVGNYTVYASASYQNQNAMANTSFQLKQKISADINGDGVVNIQDLYLAARAWQSYPGHPRWDPRCDLDGNEKINIIDIILIAREYRP